MWNFDDIIAVWVKSCHAVNWQLLYFDEKCREISCDLVCHFEWRQPHKKSRKIIDSQKTLK